MSSAGHSSSDQDNHICAYVCNEDNWNENTTPRGYGATVHIFSVEKKTEKGFKDFLIYESRYRPIQKGIAHGVVEAEKNYVGTLGEGVLA